MCSHFMYTIKQSSSSFIHTPLPFHPAFCIYLISLGFTHITMVMGHTMEMTPALRLCQAHCYSFYVYFLSLLIMFPNLENKESVLGIRRGYHNISMFNTHIAQKARDFALTQSLVSEVTLRMSMNSSVPGLRCVNWEKSCLL